jgi:dihydropyrimidinase/allantoinase
MSKYDLNVVNGTVLLPGRSADVDIGVAGGRIQSIAQPGTLPAADRTIDATGWLVLPGIIDSHFHCRAPANPEREDFATGTRAAAAGGVTTVIEMPISVPPTTDGASLAVRRADATPNIVVDLAFYSSSATLVPEKIQSALAEGAVAYKAFLQDVPPGREDEFTGLCIYRHHDIMRALELVKETGTPAVFHAEDFDTLTYLGDRLQQDGRNDIAAHWEWRPSYVEAISVSTITLMAEALGAHVHLPHISSRLAVEIIRAAKQRGAPVTAETCPQYLAFDRSTLVAHGPFAKCNPPFKTADDIAALWEGLRDGTIDTIATDHSPFTVEEKEAGWSDIWKAPPGFPGVEVLTAFMIGAALNGKLPLTRAVELITSAPADIFGLSPRKGRIQPDADADLTLYDPSHATTVDITEWESRSRASGRVWNGLPVTGRVIATIVRGTVVYERDEVVGSPGYGEVIGRTGIRASAPTGAGSTIAPVPASPGK